MEKQRGRHQILATSFKPCPLQTNEHTCLNTRTIARKMNSGIGSHAQILHHFLSSDPTAADCIPRSPVQGLLQHVSMKVHTQLLLTHVTCRSQPPLPALASDLPINFLSGSSKQEHFLCCPSFLQQRALNYGTLSHG